MKRTLRIVGAIALCLTMIPTLTSCKDDEPGNGGNAVIMDGTRLTSVGDIKISYDSEGRVYRFGDDTGYVEIDYKNGLIIPSGYNEDGVLFKVKFNGKGYISSLTQNWRYDDFDEWSEGIGTASFSYDGDGHLVKVTTTTSEDYSENGESGKYSEKSTIELTWRNGNLIHVAQNGTESDGYEWSEDYALGYNMQENKFRQMTWSQFSCIFEKFSYMACVGMFGVGSELLPSRIEETDDGYSDTTDLRFTLNSNGTIASEKIDGYTYRYGYGDVAVVRSASDAKIFPSTKGIFFRTHRDRHNHQ